MSVSVVSYGGGVNSKAMLIGLHARGERPDAILNADPGAELPETYADIKKMSRWCEEHGFPPITRVEKVTTRAGKFRGANEVLTLERRCLEEKDLPSIAYGYKTCSLKFKREPQDRWVANWETAKEAWKRGERVTRVMGYDAGEPWRAKLPEEKRYEYRYPLIEWGWDREECVEAILQAGLCVPPKSSCFFCPNMGELEIFSLRDNHPDLLERALALEANWQPTPGSMMKGLSRDMSWKQILEYDAKQMAFIPRSLPKTPCDCYDGGPMSSEKGIA